MEEYVQITWQDGTIREVGRNGVQVAEVLEVVLNQLKGYQTQFPCKERKRSSGKRKEHLTASSVVLKVNTKFKEV